jgi:fluoride ion exporter CrcB/FEX
MHRLHAGVRRVMKRRTQVVVAAAVGMLLLAASGWAQSPNLYILRADPSQQSAISQTYGLNVVQQFSQPQAVVVTGPASVSPDGFVDQVRADSRVTAFELVRNAQLVEGSGRAQQTAPVGSLSPALSSLNSTNFFGSPAWVSYVTQPALAQIDWAWNSAAFRQSVGSNTPGYGAVVAVIDTGVDPSHPALQGVLLPGYDFVHNQPGASELVDLNQSTAAILNQSTSAILNQSTSAILNGSQVVQLNQSTAAILDQSTAAILNASTLPAEFGHGTMVAGLIHLVAPGAQIMPLKAFSSDGSAANSDIIRAIYYAVDNGANVINMSFTEADLSSELLLAVNYANRHGVVCVASVGNTAQTAAAYPASLGEVLGVGSVSAAGALSTFSSYGPDLLTLVAPGEGLITTYPGSHWAGVSGTSFSAALVTGNVAVGLGSENQQGTNPADYSDSDDAMDAIASVNPYDPILGWGDLDVAQMSQIEHLVARHHKHEHSQQ